ncbi:MAG: hypothetical protein ACFBSC_05620 [Microcoleaceae cyanobacterium]
MKFNFSPTSESPPNSIQLPKRRRPRPALLALMLTSALAIQVYPGVLQVEALKMSGIEEVSPNSSAREDMAGNPTTQSQSPDLISIPPKISVSISPKVQKAQLQQTSYRQPVEQKPISQFLGTSLFNPSRPWKMAQSSELPDQVMQAVLKDATERSGLEASELTVASANPKNWPNGCLGLAEPDVFCTMAIVPGWEVTVASDSQQWVYRTNQTGSLVKFDQVIK